MDTEDTSAFTGNVPGAMCTELYVQLEGGWYSNGTKRRATGRDLIAGLRSTTLPAFSSIRIGSRELDRRRAVRIDGGPSAKRSLAKFFSWFLLGGIMKTKASAESSPRGKRVRRSVQDIRAYAKSEAAKADSQRLRAPGVEPSQADLRQIPELTEAEWKSMYRPRKQRITARIDADLLYWLKRRGKSYQTEMNSVLREAMVRELTEAK